MAKLSPEKANEISELVSKQKKAKLNWVAMVTQVSEEDIRDNIEDLGLLLEDDHIVLPSESRESKAVDLYLQKREQVLTSILESRYYHYNPATIANNALDRFMMGDREYNFIRQGILSLIDRFTSINYIIHKFNGEVIVVKGEEAIKILESMKAELRSLPDKSLRLFVLH